MSQQPAQPHGPRTRDARETGPRDDQAQPVVVTQDGMGVSPQPEDEDAATNPADLVEQPAKVMRIGSMIKQLLEEVRNAPLDEAGRVRLAEIHRRSIEELKDGLAPELIEELERIALPFGEQAPTDAELRIAQAQLVGWLEGLFHGIQTALFAQQMAAQAQLAEMRRALPPGPGGRAAAGPGPLAGMPGQATGPEGEHPTGQYL
jgi:hypothetical protein